MVFYDLTTFYFDSEVQKEEALRHLGFGRDGKIGKTQILFSLGEDRPQVHKLSIYFEQFIWKNCLHSKWSYHSKLPALPFIGRN